MATKSNFFKFLMFWGGGDMNKTFKISNRKLREACCSSVQWYFIRRQGFIGLWDRTTVEVMLSNFKCKKHFYLKRGDRRVRIFSAHNNWWATPEVSLLLPYQRSAKVFLNFLRQGVKTMYYFKNMHSKLLKCAK